MERSRSLCLLLCICRSCSSAACSRICLARSESSYRCRAISLSCSRRSSSRASRRCSTRVGSRAVAGRGGPAISRTSRNDLIRSAISASTVALSWMSAKLLPHLTIWRAHDCAPRRAALRFSSFSGPSKDVQQNRAAPARRALQNGETRARARETRGAHTQTRISSISLLGTVG